jgi:Protein of unknown function (DUF1553)/Protein of unknown function (DUF1549)/Planctomycete cytochrome C
MLRSHVLLALVGLLLAQPAPAAVPLFEKEVLPIFQAKCLGCHGADKRKAALDLRTKAVLLRGGESGPAITPSSAEKSLLWVKIVGDEMPPGKDKLSSAEKGVVKAWLDAGAHASENTAVVLADNSDKQVTDADRQFWSFRPPARPPIPPVKQTGRVRNPIDAFVLAALEKKGLDLSAEADKLTLLRRVSFDLTGLPPSPGEVEAFLKDASPDAYEKVVDRLLAAPAYGERWARHWLDVAGYADSEGILDADYPRTAAWRYRDYVIRSFNADKPYDRFLKEQLAGDELTEYWTAYQTKKELPAEVVEGLIATGYLRCASDTSRPDFAQIKNAPGYYYQTLDDTVKIVASGLLGLTVQCARCHSHKYDPIPQTDYYRMQAIFMSAYRPAQWVPQAQRRLLEATAAQEQEGRERDAAIAKVTQQANQLRQQFAEKLFNDRLAALPEAIRADVKLALAAAPASRNEVQKYLASKFQADLRPDPAQLPTVLGKVYPEYVKQNGELTAAIQAEQAKRPALAEIRALYDLPGEAKTPLLRRGDYTHPGFEVQPGVLAALVTPKPFQWAAPAKDAKTSKRRLAFAEWLTQPEHPLTARVLVNRLWLHHFGEGLVATPDNFGHTGGAPSHPELLDYLAVEFVARGWSVKALHRLMVTSSAYRQTSAFQPDRHETARKLDPDNRLLWRQRLCRLEAEALRDAILTVSGSLNGQMFGAPVPMVRQRDGEVVAPADASGLRRSIYLQVRRSQPLTLLQVFDQPVIETNCPRRGNSTVSSQALTLLNSEFLVRQADAFAGRVLKDKPDDPGGQALQLAFGRPATAREKTALAAFLQTQATKHAGPEAARRALADLCHMLLSANEFAYVD